MILVGRKAIAAFLGVHPDRVRELARAGAPIRVLSEGFGTRYLADEEALLGWVRVQAPRLP